MDALEWLSLSDVTFYALAWALAFASGVARSLYDDMFQSFRISLVVGAVSGFIAHATIAIYYHCTSNGVVGDHSAALGIAVAVGLFSKTHIGMLELAAQGVPALVRAKFPGLFKNEK